MLRFTRSAARLGFWLLLAAVISCSPPRQPRLVNSLTEKSRGLLDSTQQQTVFKYMQFFPDESELSIAFLAGDSTWFAGARRQNDSVICIENRASIFEIGSVTKTFTATMLAKLAYEGVIDLNAPIKNFLPVPLKRSSLNGKEITLAHLANHTSGLPKEPDNVSTNWALPGSPYQSYDAAKLYSYLTNSMTLHSTPGEKREYSNIGGGLLGHILTLITQKPYEDILREFICKPLALHRTFVTLDSANVRHLVRGRDPKGNVVPNWELNVLTGGGGIKSTAEDLATYIRAHMTDTTYYLLTQQPTIRYTEHNTAGLGWAWYTHGEKRFVDATGGTGGYSCCVIFERSTRTGVILLTNVSAFLAAKGEYITKMCRELHESLPAR